MLHRHGGHAEAVARIRWCISETALGVITGEVGAGKTVALRAALAGLDASRHTVIYLPHPAVGARGLYAALVSGLGGIPRFHTAALIAQTMDHLAAEKHERGRAVIVAVDEAHLLTADQLEELRLLTNSEMDSVAPFTGLLLGQPTLRRRIKLGAFAALDQRIALRYALPGMTEPETRDYLTHHLKLAGRADQLFSDDAAALIHQTSRGLPRVVNNIARQALAATYAANKMSTSPPPAPPSPKSPPTSTRSCRHPEHQHASPTTKASPEPPGRGLLHHLTAAASVTPSSSSSMTFNNPWPRALTAEAQWPNEAMKQVRTSVPTPGRSTHTDCTVPHQTRHDSNTLEHPQSIANVHSGENYWQPETHPPVRDVSRCRE